MLEAGAVGVASALFGAVKVAATFEQQMSAIRSVMSTSEVDQFGGALADLALKLGRDTVFTSREAAAGIETLIKAGIPVADVLNGGAEAATLLAAATGSSVVQAATVAAQVLNTFRVSGDKAGDAVNILAKTANASASDVNFLSLGLAQSGGVASGLGVSYGEAIQTLGLLSRSFISGSDAGTSYKTFLLSLTPSTDKQIEAFKRLGLITADNRNQFFNANGTIKTTAEVAGVLQRALGGLTDEQRSAAEQTLFGTDAIRAAEAFYRSGAEGVRQFQDQVAAAKSVQEQATERLNNLLGALQNLGGSLETVGILVGTLFLPGLKALADSTRGIVDQFSRLSPEAQRAIVMFTGITGAVLGIVGGAVLLGPLVGAMGASFAALAGILAGAAPFILAAAGVVAILASAWQANAGNIQGAVTRIGSILGNIGLVFQKVLTGDIKGAVDTFQAIIGALAPGLGVVLVNMRAVLTAFADSFGPILTNFALVWQKVLAGDIAGALDTFRAILGALSPPLGAFADVLGRIGGNIGGGIGKFFETVLPQVAEALGGFAAGAGAGFATFFTETLPPILEQIGSIAGDVGQGLFTFFNEKILPIADTLGRFAGDAGAGLKTFFTETLPPVLDAVGTFAGDVGAALLAFFGEKLPIVADAAGRFAGEAGAGLKTFFTDTLPAVATAIGNLGGDVGSNILTFFANHIPIVATAIGDFRTNPGEEFLAFFRDKVPAAIAGMEQFTADTGIGLVDFFQNKAPIMIAGLQLFTPAAVQPFAGFFKDLEGARAQIESLEPLLTSIGNFGGAIVGLAGAFQNLENIAFQQLFDTLAPGVTAFAAAAAPAAPVAQALGDGMTTIGQALAPVTAFFTSTTEIIKNWTKALEDAAAAKERITGGVTPGQGPVEGPPAPTQPFDWNAPLWGAAFRPGGAGGGGGPLIQIGQLIISSEAEAEAFLKRMADAVRGSAGRVNTPPDNSGHPALVTSQ